jgi:ABC-type transport system involved in cytochrome bd biosynthesis fused ATPase/permease subunit
MMPTVIMTDITPVILIMSLVVTVPLAVMILPLAVMIVFPEMIMVLFLLGVGSRRCSRNNQNPRNHRAQNDRS